MLDPRKYPPLNLPTLVAKVKTQAQVPMIFDPYRKKFVQLTPEEWVRQHFSQWLVNHMEVPASLIWHEAQIQYAEVKKRPDIQVPLQNGGCWLIVECKAPHVTLNESHWRQALAYYSVLNPNLLVITNGVQHIFSEFRSDMGTFQTIETLPKFSA